MIQSIVKDISYKELKLALLSGEVDLSCLNLFLEKKVYLEDQDLFIHAAIIGTSHFVQIRKKDDIFTEMLACNANQNFGSKELFLQPICKMSKSYSNSNDLSHYDFTHEIHNLSEVSEELDDEWTCLLKKSPIISMAYNFNDITQFPSAETKLSIQFIKSRLVIHTLHEYQEEDKVVCTKSEFSILA